MAKMKVRYRGAADTRQMSVKDLKEAGVTVPEDLVWDRKNRWSLEVEMTPELEEVLRAEGTFRLEKIKDDGTAGDIEADATKMDDTGSTIVMGDTGQVEENKRAAQEAKEQADAEANAPQSSGSDTPTGGGTTAVNSSTSTAGK